MDCEVLMYGYCVVRDWMLEHTELDVDSYITLQSLASPFMLNSGCYEHVFQIGGVLQQFISRCVVGGRVMCNSNSMYHIKNTNDDFDACSLYPSAMYFMDGFLKGLPQVSNNTSYSFLNSQGIYFIRLRIVNLSTHLDFPLTSDINKDGVRYFIHNMETEIIYIDTVGLYDLITFHEAEFEIIDGYYIKSGRHNTINNVINHLYALRLKLRQQKKQYNSSTNCY